MLSKEDISVLLFWKRKFEEVGRSGAVFVLTRDDENAFVIIAENLPFFMKKNRYASLLVVSDDAERVNCFKKHLCFPVETAVVTSEYIDFALCIENALGVFGRLYTDASTPLEDGDFYKLLGYSNASLKDIIITTVLSLDHIPDEEEIEEGRKRIDEIKKYANDLKRVRSVSGGYEKKLSLDLIEFHKKIIEEQGILKNKNVYLYADSKYAGMFIEIFRECSIAGIIDCDKSKTGTQREGIPIYNLDKLNHLDLKNDIVLVTNRGYEDVLIRLLSLGGRLNNNFFVLNPGPDIIDWKDGELEEFVRNTLYEGEKLFLKWRKQYSDEKFLLNTWKSSGDIYIAGLYLEEFIKNNCPNGCCIFVSSPAAKKVASLMGYEVEYISLEETKSMIRYIRYIGFEKANAVNLNVHFPSENIGQRSTGLLGLVDLNTFHQRMVFESETKKTKVSLKQNNSDTIFEQYNLDKKKTVLLAPYSYTLGNIPEECCTVLADRLRKEGYMVCTNIAGDEKPIEGTVGLFLPYDILLDFADKCAGIIGIRSGIFDIISSSDTKMTIYYPKRFQIYFSLKSMSLKTNNLLELNTTDYTWEEIVDETIDFMGRDT